MTFTIVGPNGDEYGLESLDAFREVYKPLGYRILRQQPAYTDWSLPDGAKDDELTPDPNTKSKRSQRVEAEQTVDAA